MDDIKATLKGIWNLPEGKMLFIGIFIFAGISVGEQVWWTNYAPKGSVRCDHTTTGIVCMRKK